MFPFRKIAQAQAQAQIGLQRNVPRRPEYWVLWGCVGDSLVEYGKTIRSKPKQDGDCISKTCKRSGSPDDYFSLSERPGNIGYGAGKESRQRRGSLWGYQMRGSMRSGSLMLVYICVPDILSVELLYMHELIIVNDSSSQQASPRPESTAVPSTGLS
ncbi:hypothetical protein T440DRAFT_480963 [Plenodomus tracheiphilus IPT5]|uniref:Uncharacterized protein n=1 Tax=Plenodomus tracheiphilus IPT5 TaxID=1408161 RepID=A0A6A7AYN2_9PLEO|nr:hypothetical protein T440DRAFT_480963 [Plenodomus tracheiphilus IPT5]